MPFLEEGWREKQKQRSSRLFGGGGADSLPGEVAALAVSPRSIWKKGLNSTIYSNICRSLGF